MRSRNCWCMNTCEESRNVWETLAGVEQTLLWKNSDKAYRKNSSFFRLPFNLTQLPNKQEKEMIKTAQLEADLRLLFIYFLMHYLKEDSQHNNFTSDSHAKLHLALCLQSLREGCGGDIYRWGGWIWYRGRARGGGRSPGMSTLKGVDCHERLDPTHI